MDAEHKFNPGDRVLFNGKAWTVRNFMGNRIYTLQRAYKPWVWEFAYESEVEQDLIPALTESIAQAKAKKGE